MENSMEIKSFEYNLLDKHTAEFLKIKELNMKSIASTMINQLGRELKEAQDELAGNNQYNGVFEKWYTSLGFKKTTVYNYINKYKYIASSTVEQAEIIEELPAGLVYEITKPSANKEINEKVFNGDITSLKEYRKIEKEKKELEEQLEETQYKYNEVVSKNTKLLEQEPTVIEKEVPVEVVPDDYNYYKKSAEKLQDQVRNLKRNLEDKESNLESVKSQIEILERKAKLNENDSIKYKQLKDQIENLSKQKDDLGRQIKSRTELSGLVVRIENMLKTELAPIKYSRAINEAKNDEIVIKNLNEIVGRVEDWCYEMKNYTNNTNIIKAEVINNG